MTRVSLAFAFVALAGVAWAQAPNPTEEAIARQIGALVIQNQKLVAAVEALNRELDATVKKCGKPCEPASATPKPEEKK